MSRLRHTSPHPHSPLHPASPPASLGVSRAPSSHRKRPLDISERKEEDDLDALQSSHAGSIIPPPRSASDDEDDAVSDLLNGPPSTPLPRRKQQPAVVTSSPLTIAHFDRSPLRSHLSPPPYHQHQRDARDRPLHAATQRVLQLSPPSPAALRVAQLLNGPSDVLLLSLDHWRLRLLSSHFVAWREHRAQAKQERERLLLSLQHWSRRLQRLAFTAWRDRTRRGDWLLEVWRRRLEASVMRAWRGHAVRRRELYAVAHRVADRGEESLLRAAWSQWKLDAQLQLSAGLWHVKRKSGEGLQRWTAAVLRHRQRAQRAEMVEEATARRQEAATANALSLWYAWTRERRRQAEQQRKAERHRLRVVMTAWRAQLPQAEQHRMRRKQEAAASWRDRRLLLQTAAAWHQWSLQLQQVKSSVETQRRQRLLTVLWTAWRKQWAHAQSERQRDEETAALHAARLAAAAFASVFQHWQQRTAAILTLSSR